eukprot:scaffold22054_cov78-Skeletonema_dohrnii-CCMP3373.AAC.1
MAGFVIGTHSLELTPPRGNFLDVNLCERSGESEQKPTMTVEYASSARAKDWPEIAVNAPIAKSLPKNYAQISSKS